MISSVFVFLILAPEFTGVSEEKVTWADVPVRYVDIMHLFDSQDNLSEKPQTFLFRHRVFFPHSGKDFLL